MKRFAGRWLGTALVAACTFGAVLSPNVALADGEAPITVKDGATDLDTVHLRSGGLFRGRATEIVPGDHVTVVVPGGETRRIPWSDVDRVIVASPTIPPPLVSPNARGDGAAPPAEGPRARVYVKASGHATLYRRPAGSKDFVSACDAPCGIELPIGDTYKIGGSGFKTTNEFKLDVAPGGSVEVEVDGPSWVGIIGGGLLTLTGGGFAYLGTVFTLAGSCNFCDDDMQKIGLVSLGLGVAGILGGLAIVNASMKTDIAQERGLPSRDAFVRTPTWRSASASEAQAPSATFPLVFQTRF